MRDLFFYICFERMIEIFVHTAAPFLFNVYFIRQFLVFKSKLTLRHVHVCTQVQTGACTLSWPCRLVNLKPTCTLHDLGKDIYAYT